MLLLIMSPVSTATLVHKAHAVPTVQLPSFHIGPMSRAVVDAALAVAAKTRQQLCLIASRRQIECAAFGGGYVNGWTTETFANYVRGRDTHNLITLARDHGGPYQRDDETGLAIAAAMARAQTSFAADIDAGLRILHLDPEKAVARGTADSLEKFTSLTIEMLRGAGDYAMRQGHDITFEIGTDEGAGEDFTPEAWDQFLARVFDACQKYNLPLPQTFAVPMGTKTKEARNVGGLATGDSQQTAFWGGRIAALQKIAVGYGIALKLHNFDYMSHAMIANYRALGIGYFNVAPEFGVVESRTLLNLLRAHDMPDLADRFIALAVASNKWQRWLLPASNPADDAKALIAGHYIFATPDFIVLKNLAAQRLATRGINLDASIQTALEQAITHYL